MPPDIAADAVLVFTLRVTDAGGLFAQDSVRVSVAPPPADAPAGTTEVLWSADVTVTDYGGAFGAITADSFTNVTGGELGVEWIWYSVGVRRLDLILSEAATAAGELTLHLDDVALAFPQGSSGETIIRWRPIRLSWKNGQTVAVRLTRTSQAPEPVNTSPTGLPAIAATPRVGEALRASVSGIADADGLSGATFGYQWLSHDGTADTAISGATQAVYTLVASDAGNTIKVRVTFTDDRGTEETLTSVATAAVEATVPDAPRNLSIAAPDGKEGVLEVSWVAPSSDGGSAVAGYQVQWRSGFEDYDGTAASARQAAVTDLAGLTHTISGLTNGVAYTVRVIATNGVGDGAATAAVTGTPRDRVRPELSAAAVDGDTLVLNYNEALDEASEPGASAFAVQAGAASRGVTRVAVSGNTVTLTLASAVSSSDEVTVRYVAPEGPGAKPIRDVSGNNAAPVLRRTVRNDTITGVISIAITSDPGPDRIYTLGRSSLEPEVIEVTVTFSERVTVTGVPVLLLDAGKPGSLTLQSPYRFAEYHGGSGTAALTFRYTVSEGDNKPDGVSVPDLRIQLRGGTIRDGANNDAVLTHSGLAAQPGHKLDGARPSPIAGGAVANGTTLTLTFDEALDEDSVPTPGYGFLVTERTVTGIWVRTVTGIWVNGNVVTLALNLPVSPGGEINVGYIVPYYRDSDAIRDLAGNLADNFRDAVPVLTEDTMAPRVTRVDLIRALGHNWTYIIGESFDVTVTFNESVTVDATNGSPSLGLNVGDVVKQAVYHSGTGTAMLTFRYTVAEHDEDTDGVERGDMVANGGTIRDGSGNDAVLTLPEKGTTHRILVDGVRPALTATNGATAAGAGHHLLLKWSERLHSDSEPAADAFTLAGGAVSRSVADVQKVGLWHLKLIITPPIEHGETGITLGYAVPTGPDASPIRDWYGNTAAAFSGQAVAEVAEDTVSPNVSVQCVDPDANLLGPQVSGNHSLSWELHFSEPVTHADDTSARSFEIAGQDDTDFSWLAIGGLAGSLHYRYFTTPVVSLEDRGAVSDVNGVVITVPAGWWQDRSGNLNTASANSLYLAHNWKVSGADASATEGTDGTIDFEVTLNARDDCETVTVDWVTADGSATAGEDYIAANGTLSFGPGETSKTVSVGYSRRHGRSSGETLTLQLGNASAMTLADAEATGTISDEESPFVSMPQIDGVPQVGNTLEVSFAEPPSGALAYQWLRGSK